MRFGHQTLQEHRASQARKWFQRFDHERRQAAVKRAIQNYIDSGRARDSLTLNRLDDF